MIVKPLTSKYKYNLDSDTETTSKLEAYKEEDGEWQTIDSNVF